MSALLHLARPAAPAPSRGVSLHAAGLTRRFGSAEVLRGIDLDVPAGQFLAIVGKSGCGKSTLLRLLAGIDRPTAGTVRVGAAPGRPLAPRLMFQEPRLLPWERVLGNVEVGLGAARAGAGARQAALETLAAVGLRDRAGDWPAVLSGGQKQRVALARALVSHPGFLALDEPLGALDALTRIEMQSLLDRVWREQGFTAVLVTHDVTEALMLADRVIVIEDGVVSLDLPVEIARPRRRGSVTLARLEEDILRRLLGAAAVPADYVI